MSDKPLKYTEITDELGAELRRIRTGKNLTLFQVADALNAQDHQVSNVHLSRIETGQRRIDDDLLRILCDYYQEAPEDVAVRASKAHIDRILATVPDAPDSDTPLPQQIEDAASELNEDGQRVAAHLLKYIKTINSLKK